MTRSVQQKLFFVFVLVICCGCMVLGQDLRNDSYVKRVDFSVFFEEKYHGNLMFLERWTYFFDTPHSQIFRTLPAGYSPHRNTNNDGIGSLVVAVNNSIIHEVLPSLHHHQPNTFEVFEDEENLHIYVHFPPTTGEIEFIFAYEVAGGLILTLLPLLHPTKSSVPEVLNWPIISSNNPLPVHNVTIEFTARMEFDPQEQSINRDRKSAILARLTVLNPSAVELSRKTEDLAYIYKAGWPEGTEPLPAMTEYKCSMKIRPNSQANMVKLSSWQRILITQKLCNYVIGLLIIAMTFAPLLPVLYYRSKWVEITDLDSTKPPPTPKDILSVHVLLDNMRISDKAMNLLSANWILNGIVRVQGEQYKLAKNYKNKVESEVERDALELIFNNGYSACQLTPKEYKKRVRRVKAKLAGIGMDYLVRNEFLYKDLRFALRDFRILYWIQRLFVIGVILFPKIRILVENWMEIENFYLINGCLFVAFLLVKSHLNTRSTKGSVSRAWWLAYLHRNAEEENKTEQSLLEAFRWGKQTLTREQCDEWISANINQQPKEVKKHCVSFLYSICE